MLTVRKVADYLKVEPGTIYRMAAAGQIPGFKVGGSWRFKKSEIDAWMDWSRTGPKRPETGRLNSSQPGIRTAWGKNE